MPPYDDSRRTGSAPADGRLSDRSAGSAENARGVIPATSIQHLPVSRDSAHYISDRKKRKRRHGALVGVVAFLIALLCAGVAGAVWFVTGVNTELSGGDRVSEAEKMAAKETLEPTTSYNEPFYMMLIGSDRRADDESMGARSDTNILVRVDPTTYTVSMISIPRDTKVDISGYGTNKFNACYNFGGAALVIKEASELTGAKISHYAEVNFEELIALIDAIGGVEVDVPERIDDPDAGPYIIEPGLQTLDGDHALEFARCRSYADGDFTRTSNQRLLIEAVSKKVLNLPITELPNVITKAAKCVVTDLSLIDIYSLAMKFREAPQITMYSAMVPSTTAMIDGVSYVIADKQGLADMMDIVDSGGDPNDVVLTSGATKGSSLQTEVATQGSTISTAGTGDIGSSSSSGSNNATESSNTGQRETVTFQ